MISQERLQAIGTLNLLSGSHESFEKGVCAMEAVAWLAGEKHSDKPDCACPVIAGVIRSWNDGLPNDAERNRLIRPLLAKLVGTRIDSDSVLLKRMYLVQDWNIRVRTPAFLRLAKLEMEAEALEDCAQIVDTASMVACEAATSAARSAADSAADSAASMAVCEAATSAAYSAADSAARSAAYSAAYSAAGSAAYSAAEAVFASTVSELQTSFVALIETLCQVES
jgi:hypothetical protein